MFSWIIDHYEVVITNSNGLNYTYICKSENEINAYIEEYGIQVVDVKQISRAILPELE